MRVHYLGEARRSAGAQTWPRGERQAMGFVGSQANTKSTLVHNGQGQVEYTEIYTIAVARARFLFSIPALSYERCLRMVERRRRTVGVG